MKKILVLYIFCGCFFNYVGAEQKEIDVSINKNDIFYIKQSKKYFKKNSSELIQESKSFLYKRKYEKAMNVAHFAYIKAHDPKDKAKVLFIIARIYEEMGFIGNARLKYRQIIRTFYKEKDVVRLAKDRLIRVLNNKKSEDGGIGRRARLRI